MRPVVLLILDGWGINRPWSGNAVSLAKTPNFLRLAETCPFFSLQASGLAVGLPWGEPGNSEVGHLTLGAGRIVTQYLRRILETIYDGSFFKNPALKAARRTLQKTGGRLHLVGLVSSGTVHAYIEHLYALLEFARRENIRDVYLHVFTDGMDSPPHEAQTLLPQIEERLRAKGPGAIASIIGRTFAMDRSGRWELTEKAFRVLVGSAERRARTVAEALRLGETTSGTDAAFPPTAIVDANGAAPGAVRPEDTLVFFNFREDSMRQLARAFAEKDFRAFPRPELSLLPQVITLTQYDASLPALAAFPPLAVPRTLSEIISTENLPQLHIAEQEKYAHVTFFFNGWRAQAFPGETQRNVSADAFAAAISDAVYAETYAFIVANLAGADVAAHTGDIAGTVKAIERIDRTLGQLAKTVAARRGLLVITADHGHAEEMLNPLTREVRTEHTAYPVPLIVAHGSLQQKSRPVPWAEKIQKPDGVLADVAPLVLSFLGLPQPDEMTGKTLLSVSNL